MSTRLTPGLLMLPVTLCLWGLAGCGATEAAHPLSPGDTVRAAQQLLTDRCLTDQGLTPPRPGPQQPSAAEQRRVSNALFGTGRTELSLSLPTGYDVRAHTDGCLASAQRTLYGDQRRWFTVSTTVNNLKPEAAHRRQSIASVRALHRAELDDWRSMRVRALDRATELLHQQQPPEKETDPS